MLIADVKINGGYVSASLGIRRYVYKAMINDLVDLLQRKHQQLILLMVEDLLNNRIVNGGYYESKALTESYNQSIDNLLMVFDHLDSLVKSRRFDYTINEIDQYLYVRLIIHE